MIVWLVYRSSYEEDGIDSVWTTKELAERRLKELEKENWFGGYVSAFKIDTPDGNAAAYREGHQ